MPYLILIAGLIIIFISLKAGQKQQESPIRFDTRLKEKLNLDDNEFLKEQLYELSLRVDELEKAMLLLNDKIDGKGISAKSIPQEAEEEIIFEDNSSLKNEDDINTMIYKLYDDGMSIDEICSSLMIGKGEALLRIGLRKQKQ